MSETARTTDPVLGAVQAAERSWPVVRAGREHLEAIVALLADDALGRDREAAAEDGRYRTAFHAIDADPNQALLVVLDDAGHANTGERDQDTGPAVGGEHDFGNRLAEDGRPGEMPQGVVATAQLTFIPGLSRGGALRAQIEAVRVAAAHRGQGLGEAFFTWMLDYSAGRGAQLVQLTTDRQRPDALRFYERLGFTASHHGMKLTIGPTAQ